MWRDPERPHLDDPDGAGTRELIRKLKRLETWYRRQDGSDARAAADHLRSTLKHHPLRDDLLRDWERFGM